MNGVQLTEKQKQAIAIGDTLPAYEGKRPWLRAPKAEILKLWASDSMDDKGRAWFIDKLYTHFGTKEIISISELEETAKDKPLNELEALYGWSTAVAGAGYTMWNRQVAEWQFFAGYWRLRAQWKSDIAGDLINPPGGMDLHTLDKILSSMTPFIYWGTGLNAYLYAFRKVTGITAVKLLKINFTEGRQALEALDAIGVPLTITDPKKLKAKPLPEPLIKHMERCAWQTIIDGLIVDQWIYNVKPDGNLSPRLDNGRTKKRR